MAWLDLLPAVGFTAALLFGPGLLITVAAGLRGFAALALAPGASLTVVAVSAIVAGLAGVHWSWPVPVLAATVVALVAFGVRLAVRRRGAETPERRPWWAATDTWALLGAGLGGVLWVRHLRNVLDTPNAMSQTFDNIFHLSAIRLIHESGDASSLTLARLNAAPGDPTFYPAAFHDLASLVFALDPTQLTFAVNGVVIVLVAVVWPLACVFLVSCLTRLTPALALGTGWLSAAFTSFPLLLLQFGILYPNLTGLIVLPLAVGLTAQLFAVTTERRLTWVEALFGGALVLPGMALAHPNVVMAFFLFAAPIVIARAVDSARRWYRERGHVGVLALQLLGLAAILLVPVLIWPIARPPEEAAGWQPIETTAQAAGEALLNAPIGARSAWLVSALVLVGLLAARRRGLTWVIGSWLVVILFWIVVAGLDNLELRLSLTGVWYNDPFRLAALLTPAALPLAALGFSHLADAITGLFPRAGARTAVVVAVAVTLTFLGVVLTQRAPYLNVAVDRASAEYAWHPESPLLSPDEYALLQRLPQHVAEGEAIATNPLNGSSLAYAFTGRPTTTLHALYHASPEVTELNDHLDEATSRPSVCPAVRTLDVAWALDFGERFIHNRTDPVPGFDSLDDAPGFEEVDRQGDAVLYRVTGCS